MVVRSRQLHIFSIVWWCVLCWVASVATISLAETPHRTNPRIINKKPDRKQLPFATGLVSPPETDRQPGLLRRMAGMSNDGSEDDGKSSSVVHTVSITPTKFPSTSMTMTRPPCPTTSSPPSHSPSCDIAVSVRVGSVVGLDAGTLNSIPITSCPLGGGLSVTIPHPAWSTGGGGYFCVSLRINSSLQEFYRHTPTTYSGGGGGSLQQPTETTQTVQHSIGGLFVGNSDAFHNTSSSGLWMVVRLKYIGPILRNNIVDSINITVPTSQFNCDFEEDVPVVVVPLQITLTAPVSPLPEEISTVMDVAVGVSVVIGVPSVMIRAGIISTLTQMLYCFEFDPEEEVGFVNNPFGWAVGREELQYHRGSVITVLIVAWCLVVCLLGLVVMVRICGKSVTTWGAACSTLRLPSLALVPLLLLSEVCVSSAISMLFYGDNESSDIILSLVVLIMLCGYMGIYVFQTISSRKYITVEVVSVPSTKAGHISRVIRYLAQPTHDVVLLSNSSMNEGWLRRNYYFVAERRWATFGAFEVVAGTLINMLEGIPLTTSSRALCIARPACVMIITSFLLVVLIWKVPNAVRMQQWCSVAVMAGMILTACLATVHAVSPSDGLELATGYMGVVVVGASMILGLIDTLVLIITYIPILCKLLSLNPRGLQSTIERSMRFGRGGQQQQGVAAAALQVPVLGAAAAGNPPYPPPNLPIQDAPVADDLHPPPPPREDPPEAPRRRRRPQRARQGDAPQTEDEIMHQILEELEELDRQEAEKKRKKGGGT